MLREGIILLIWNKEQPVFVLPWRGSVVVAGYAFTLTLFFAGVFGLWQYGPIDWVNSMVVVFMGVSVGLWLMVRHGRAQLEGNAIVYWRRGMLIRKRINHSLMNELNLMGSDPLYERIFLERAADLSQRCSETCKLPSRVESCVVDFGVMRAWSGQDLESHQDIFSDPDLMQWHDMPMPQWSESLARIAYSESENAYRSLWSYAIEIPNAGVVGHFELRLLSKKGRSVELSFGLKAPYRGRGWMSRCWSTVLREWSTRFGITAFYARVKVHNVASQRLLQKNGFVLCDVVDDRFLSYGSPSEVLVYEYLVGEDEEIRS